MPNEQVTPLRTLEDCMKFEIKHRFSGEVVFTCDLSSANLSSIKADVFMVLLHAIPEAPAMLAAINEGRVDGSTYEGECACLVGTIAKERHVHPDALTNGLRPDSDRPAERFFMAIKKGDTPETNPASKIAAEWVSEFIGLVSQPVAA